MKRTFLSKTVSILGAIAALSTVVSIGVQQFAQAQTGANPQSEADSSTASLTIAEIVTQSGGEYDDNPQDFDILLNALKQNDLVELLADKTTDVTVFAPDDAAFLKLSRFFGYTGDDEAAVIDVINQELANANQQYSTSFNLREVLRYHISPGAKTLDAIEELPANKTIRTMFAFEENMPDGTIISYINGNLVDIAINLIAPKIQQNFKDIPASNGVIHGIDRVLLPYYLGNSFPILPKPQPTSGQVMTIADVLAQSGDYDDNRQDFDILNRLLQTAEFADLLADPSADITLFAPTDAAFIELAQAIPGEYPEDKDLESRVADEIVASYVVTDPENKLELIVPGESGRFIYVGGDSVPQIQKVLQYHVSPGAKTASEIQGASSILTLLSGAAVTPKESNPTNPSTGFDFSNSQFQLGDTYARTANGAIQSINNVLVPSAEQLK